MLIKYFKFLFLYVILLISSISALAEKDPYALDESRTSNGFLIIKQENLITAKVVGVENDNYLYLGGSSKEDKIPNIYIRFMDIIGDDNGINLSKKLSDKAASYPNKYYTTTAKITLSNGEVFTNKETYVSDVRKEGYDFWGITDIEFNSGDVSSSIKNIADYKYNTDISSYVLNRLKEYDITKIEVDGVIIRPNDFKSSILYKKIVPKLISESGSAFKPSSSPKLKSGSSTYTPPKTSNSTTNNYNSYSSSVPEISGSIDNIWTDFNVVENYKKGMRIHVKFNVNNMRGKKGKVCIYFKYANGSELNGSIYQYITPNGKVTVQGEFVPNYDNTIFNDYSLFIPYEALNMASGKHKLAFYVQLFEYTKGSGHNFVTSNDTNFDFSK